MKHARSTQRGSALISALLIMTFVVIAATMMSSRLQLDIHRTRLSLTSDKLYLASQWVSFWAAHELTKDKLSFSIGNQQGQIAHFPTDLQTSYPGVLIKGALYDLQSRFNLNNLSDKTYQSPFLKLLQTTSIPLSEDESEQILHAIQDWIHPPITSDQNATPHWIKNRSELKLIKSITIPLYQALYKKVTALPDVTPINLNTAPKSLLMTLGNGLSEDQINSLIKARGSQGIKDLNTVNPLLKNLNIRSEHVTVESHYFMCIATVISQDLTLIHRSLFKRTKNREGKVVLSLMSEELNSLV